MGSQTELRAQPDAPPPPLELEVHGVASAFGCVHFLSLPQTSGFTQSSSKSHVAPPALSGAHFIDVKSQRRPPLHVALSLPSHDPPTSLTMSATHVPLLLAFGLEQCAPIMQASPCVALQA